MTGQVQKQAKLKSVSEMPTYEIKMFFLKQLREEKRGLSYRRIPNNMCRLRAPGSGTCPSSVECGLDFMSQLQQIEYEKGKQGIFTVEKHGKH